MKYIYIFLSLLLLASCSKKEECYECTTIYNSVARFNAAGIVNDTSYSLTDLLCNASESDMQSFVNKNSDTVMLENRIVYHTNSNGEITRTDTVFAVYSKDPSCKKVKVKK